MPIVRVEPYADRYQRRAKEQPLLVVYCSIRNQGVEMIGNVPFIVDTGAQRTMIVPHWQDRIRRRTKDFEIVGPARPAQSLFGTYRFRLARHLSIIAHCTSGKDAELNPVREGQSAPMVSLLNDRANRPVQTRFNLLGLDVLADWLFYSNPETGLRFLAHRCRYIDTQVKGLTQLATLFEKPSVKLGNVGMIRS